MTSDLARRCSLLIATLGFALVDTKGQPAPKEVQLVREWLDNWRDLGDVVTGMIRQGYRLHLTNVEESVWRATFSSAPQLAGEGFGADRKPWRAVQVAAISACRVSGFVSPTCDMKSKLSPRSSEGAVRAKKSIATASMPTSENGSASSL